MNQRRSRWDLTYLLLVAVALMWSSNMIVGRAVRDAVPPFTLSFVRWTIALVLLLPFTWTRLRDEWPLLRRGWMITILLGALGVASFNPLVYWGLHYTTATNGLLIQAAIPPLIVLIRVALFRDRARLSQVLAVALSVVGVVIIVGQGDPAVLLHLRIGAGDGLVLIAVVFWAFYSALLRLRPPVHALTFLAATFIVGVIGIAPFALWEILHGGRIRWSPGVGAAFVYLAAFPSLAAFLLYNRGVDRVGPARAGQFINLMPLLGAGLAAVVLGETLHGYHLIGGAFILVGITGFALGSDEPSTSAPPAATVGETTTREDAAP